MTRLLRLVAAAAAVAIVVAACGSGSDSGTGSASGVASAPTSTAAGPTTSAPGGGEGTGTTATAAITIKSFKYGEPLTVAPGTVVTVTNEDTAGHDVVSDDSGKFKTPVLAKGEKATFTAPTEPGTYKFSCSLHPGSMSGIGTLIVSG